MLCDRESQETFRRLLLSASVGALVWSGAAIAQDENGGENGEEDETEYLADFVEDFEKFDGLFPLYKDPDNGKLYMEISHEQLGIAPQPPEKDEDEDAEDEASADDDAEAPDENGIEGAEDSADDAEAEAIAENVPHPEFIYFVHTVDGEPTIGFFRGAYRANEMFKLVKHYDSIEFHQVNTNFYFDPENALSNAADANIADAVLARVDIEQTAEDGTSFLIPADELLKGESLHRVKPPRLPGSTPSPYGLSNLNDSKTKFHELRNYPENTDVVVEYVYDNRDGVSFGNPAITDARAVSVFVQHSFIEVPDNDYTPRADDFRVGYFTDYVDDLTSPSFTPYRDMINRWDLRKANPNADVSDPVEPITFWIENTTPVEYRDAVREGALAWNEAFEAAGISNAIRVEVQPDDAEWDAGDIRYNVLRWTSSPNPPFGGYGPSFTNPRTGQIIGADIMLENVFVTNRLLYQDIYGVDSMGRPNREAAAHAFLPPTEPSEAQQLALLEGDHQFCDHGRQLQLNLMGARAMLSAFKLPENYDTELVQAAIRELILHEIGHTLGLNHNMASSSGVPEDALNNPETPPTNSVMDYNAPNIVLPGETQGQFFMSRPGPYDIWAIQFGYTPDEDAAQAVLERSTDPALIFGNDADDMRFPGSNIDPRIMVSDLGPDSLEWARDRMELIDIALGTIKDKYTDEDDTYQDVLVSYLILTGQKASAASVASRWVGGVFQQRSEGGQDGASEPFTPVPREKQEAALALLGEEIFAADAFAYEQELLRYLQPQRRGFATFGVNEDPQVHARALAIQSSVMAHLLHPNVLTRLTDSRLYGGTYPAAEYMDDLTGYVFGDDINSSVNTIRQNLQLAYVGSLAGIASGQPYEGFFGGSYDPVARSAALASLKDIKEMVKPGLFGHGVDDAETEAHREHILALLTRAGI